MRLASHHRRVSASVDLVTLVRNEYYHLALESWQQIAIIRDSDMTNDWSVVHQLGEMIERSFGRDWCEGNSIDTTLMLRTFQELKKKVPKLVSEMAIEMMEIANKLRGIEHMEKDVQDELAEFCYALSRMPR